MAKTPNLSTLASALVAIVYVGFKPRAFDNVAGSGKTWEGNGDVQHVTELQAATLLQYPDQWARDDRMGTPQPDGDEDVAGDDALSPDDVAEILKTPLEKLTKPKLVAFAKHKLGKDLDPALGKTSMVNQIEEWLAYAE